jgi:HSP20 family protein
MFPNLFDNFFENEFPTRFERNCGCAVAANILEKDEQFEIQIAAPGLRKEDFKLEVEKNLLSVSFEKPEEENQKEESWIRREFEAGSFVRSFTIPEQTDVDKITARYENGILYIGVPRENPEKTRLSKRIEIA